MNRRADLAAAKKMLETAERKLVDVRVLRERLTLQLPNSSDEFRPALKHALDGLRAVTPRLEADFNSAHDALRALAFIQGIDADRITTRSLDSPPRGPRHREPSPRSRSRVR